MLEKYIMNFSYLFLIAEAFYSKLTIRIQNYMKNNDEKFIMYLSNISYDICYDLTKLELITQLLCGETKKENLIKG
jgi:hypothetical protein